MMRTAARPGQAVARSPEVDWRAPDPRPRRRAVPAARCIRLRCGTASAAKRRRELHEVGLGAWDAIRSDEMAEIGLPRP